MRYIIVFGLLIVFSVAEIKTFSFPIGKKTQKYEFKHFSTNIQCSSKTLTIHIKMKKRKKDFPKNNPKNFSQAIYADKKPVSFLIYGGNLVLACKKKGGNRNVFHGKVTTKNKQIIINMIEGNCCFSYNKHKIFFYYLPFESKVEMSKEAVLDMAVSFYKKQLEITRTAVVPGASQ
ncbi:hypothetical protein [Candidatus Uabimicrobium sp. HlEnr_7]|uniref:hypothetical protein n=1 Tax=Candidatus Uabimicrobium helgolandensis TaxID=3095367 RepID=UPI003555DCDB